MEPLIVHPCPRCGNDDPTEFDRVYFDWFADPGGPPLPRLGVACLRCGRVVPVAQAEEVWCP